MRPFANRAALLAAGAVLALALPAASQPERAPKRDFAITYRTEGGMPGHGMRISYQAASRMQRLQPDGADGMIMLIDMARGSMTMINTEARVYFVMTGGESRPPWADTDRYRFERAGSDRVAGTPCTVWRMLEGAQQRGTACATDDGITLRAEWTRDGTSGRIEATEISLARQPDENFRVPPGFHKVEMPGMPPGTGGPPSGGPPGGPPRR